jgi:hypothetical protein
VVIRACDVDENSPASFRKPIAQGHAKQHMGELNEFTDKITKTGEKEHGRDFFKL